MAGIEELNETPFLRDAEEPTVHTDNGTGEPMDQLQALGNDSVFRHGMLLLFAVPLLSGLLGNPLLCAVMTFDRGLKKLALAPLLQLLFAFGFVQSLCVEVPNFVTLATGAAAIYNIPYACNVHIFFGFFASCGSITSLCAISVVRYCYFMGWAWFRRPRTRSRIFARTIVGILTLSVLYGCIAFCYQVPLSPSLYLYCDAYSSGVPVPLWYTVWDGANYIFGQIIPTIITLGLYWRIFHIYNKKSNWQAAEYGMTRSLFAVFAYGVVSITPLSVARVTMAALPYQATVIIMLIATSFNSVNVLIFPIFSEGFRTAIAKVLRCIFLCQTPASPEAAWVPVWSGTRSHYIWVKTVYTGHQDVQCSIVLCAKRPGTSNV